ncbi:hypothetical protein Tco_0123297 [Tanacetum coccineum]
MSSMSEDIQCASSWNTPTNHDRIALKSWQQRILYTLTEGGEGALHLGLERARVFADLSAEQKDRYKADIPSYEYLITRDSKRHLHTSSTTSPQMPKNIWDNEKMILEVLN